MGPEELGFVAASEAMVNIRHTLDAACSQDVIAAATRQKLTAIAKSIFYPERRYPEILERGLEAGCPGDELAAFDAWREAGKVDVKRDDALRMLRKMADRLDGGLQPKSVAYPFAHNDHVGCGRHSLFDGTRWVLRTERSTDG